MFAICVVQISSRKESNLFLIKLPARHSLKAETGVSWNLLMWVEQSAKINADRQSWTLAIPPPGYFKHQIWTQLAILHTKGSFKRMKLILKRNIPFSMNNIFPCLLNHGKSAKLPWHHNLNSFLVLVLLWLWSWNASYVKFAWPLLIPR